MMRVVLDANVLVSGCPAPDGVPGRLIAAWLHREFDLARSEHILAKVTIAWGNSYFRARYCEKEAQRALALLRRRGIFVIPITVEVKGIASHAQDDLVLATAVSGRADYLVTSDIPFRGVGEHQGASFSIRVSF